MKTNRILTLLITSVMFAVSSPRTQAAGISVDISSYAPRNAKVILRQIELNVAIKQYEKTLMLLHEIQFQQAIGPDSNVADTPEIQKQKESHWKNEMNKKLQFLELKADQLRNQIKESLEEAQKEAEVIEKEKSAEKAKL